jgi:hypothetical protein
MPSSTAARRLTAGFGLCAAVFLGVAVAPWAIDPREFLAPGWRGNEIAGEVAPALPPLPQTPPLDRLAAIVEQPLFSSTRRPAAAPPPPASTEGLVLGAYRSAWPKAKRSRAGRSSKSRRTSSSWSPPPARKNSSSGRKPGRKDHRLERGKTVSTRTRFLSIAGCFVVPSGIGFADLNNRPRIGALVSA